MRVVEGLKDLYFEALYTSNRPPGSISSLPYPTFINPHALYYPGKSSETPETPIQQSNVFIKLLPLNCMREVTIYSLEQWGI